MKIVTIVGARPQFIKCASLSRELRKAATEILVHTGQHYDDPMSDIFFRELEIPPPHYNLNIGSGSHAAQTGQMMQAIEKILQAEKPDFAVVYGDTNTTLAGALAAVKLHIPIAHVEAGVRSFNKQMPEEINRILTDRISTLLFCPTQTAVQNLLKEAIASGVHLVGDIMIDAAHHYGQKSETRSDVLERFKLKPKSYAVATLHRAENADDAQRLFSILAALDEIAQSFSPVLIPLHPRSVKQMKRHQFKFPALQIIEPVSYLDMLRLQKNAQAVLTDSGGVQREACVFQVPCITFRDDTEWPETVETGWNVLTGADKTTIVEKFKNLKKGSEIPEGYEPKEVHTSRKITEILTQQFSASWS